MPFAVYTHVRWSVGALTAGEVKTFEYRAAIPIRANVKEFTGGTKPSGASGEQAANLDNNTGLEVLDETLLSTFATASGTYQGGTPGPTSDETILDRTGRGLGRAQGRRSLALEQGQNVKWTLTFETSEYKYVNEASSPTPCRTASARSARKTSPWERPRRRRMQPGGGQRTELPVQLGGRKRQRHLDADLERGPVHAGPAHRDQRQVHADLLDPHAHPLPAELRTDDADPLPRQDHQQRHHRSRVRPLPGARKRPTAENPATKITHEPRRQADRRRSSAATIEAESPTLEKVRQHRQRQLRDGDLRRHVPQFHPGDTVCWQVRITFPGTLDTTADDRRLPAARTPNTSPAASDPHGEQRQRDHRRSAAGAACSPGRTGATVPAGGQIFERVIATEVAPVGNVGNGDLKGNLLKFSSANTRGSRKRCGPKRTTKSIPPSALVKGVEKVVRGGTTVNGPRRKRRPHPGRGRRRSHLPRRPPQHRRSGSDQPRSPRHPPGRVLVQRSHRDRRSRRMPDGGGPGDHIVWHVPTALRAADQEAHLHRHGAGRRRPGPDAGQHRRGRPVPGRDQHRRPATPTRRRKTSIRANATNRTRRPPKTRATSTPTAPRSARPRPRASKRAATTPHPGDDRRDDHLHDHREVPGGRRSAATAELTDTLNSAERQAYVGGLGGSHPERRRAPGRVHARHQWGDAESHLPGGLQKPGRLRRRQGRAQIQRRRHQRRRQTCAPPPDRSGQTSLDRSHPRPPVDQLLDPHHHVVEPLISQEKSDNKNPSRVAPGEIITYTVKTADSGGGQRLDAHEIELDDHVPVGLIARSSTKKPASRRNPSPTGGAIWNSTTRTITEPISSLAPGAKSRASTTR